jgi:uncharacterized cofD-like protein
MTVAAASDPGATRHAVTVIGGGTGSFQVLSGLREHDDLALASVVAISDSGGDSGRLRDEFDVLPPGDLRRCFLALCEDSGMLRDLFSFRFEEEALRGRQLGNLLYVALTRIYGSEPAAVRALHRLLKVRGRVLPASWDKVHLCAELANKRVLRGETHIDVPRHDPAIPIRRVFLDPPAAPNPEALETIAASDFLVLAPGDLFTSLVATFLVRGVPEVLQAATAPLIYLPNLMTKRGETDGFSVSHFVEQIIRYSGRVPDAVLIQGGRLPDEITRRYLMEEAQPVDLDEERVRALGVKIVRLDDLAARQAVARHDPERTATALRALFAQISVTARDPRAARLL